MAPRYSVEEMLALDKTGLVDFIKANLDDRNGVNVTSIRDLRDAPESRRTELVQKLIEAYPIAAQEAPLAKGGFQLLLDKLDNAPSGPKALRQSAPTSPEPRSPTPLPRPEAIKEYQIQCYHALIDDGGRPPCSLETLDELYQDFTGFDEPLRPWLAIGIGFHDADDLGVFSRPLARWKQFRRWQRDNRGGMTAEERLVAFTEEMKRDYESTEGCLTQTEQEFEDSIRRKWQYRKYTTEWREVREVKNGNFTDYVKAARRRLAKHDFYETFRLLKDPRRQAERATWIEYLVFECWWLDSNAKLVQHRKPPYNAAWEELVQSGVLRAGETEEDVLVYLANATRDQQNTPRTEAIKHFVRQTKVYRDARALESRQSLRVQWALSQIPKKSAATEPIARTGKRRLQEDAEGLEETVEQRPVTKKQRTEPERKQDDGGLRRKRATTTQGWITNQTSGLLMLTGSSWELVDGKRRSTRIKHIREQGKGVDYLMGRRG